MIGKAKAISHGINNLRYIMGESKNKKHPEKIDFICTQHLPQGLDAMGVWESMQASLSGHNKLKNTLIQIELSPAKEHTKHFTVEDWKRLWMDFIEEFDKQTIKDKNNKVKSKPTNLAGSKAVVCLHRESKGEIPHVHGGVCRVDEDGNINNDHEIHLRAQRAAEAVAVKRGWATAMDVRTSNTEHITSVCMNILKDMPRWSWEDYVTCIERTEGENLKVKARTDSQGNVKGYAIICGKAKYKSSELGKNRSLTYSRLAATWSKLHPVSVIKQEEARPSTSQPASRVNTNHASFPVNHKHQVLEEDKQYNLPRKDDSRREDSPFKESYTTWAPDRRSVDIEVDGTKHHLYLPKDVLQLFDDIFDYREVKNWKPLTNLACAYFAALLAPEVHTSAGGGSSNNTGWSGKKDEDELDFARRCAQMAKSKLGIAKKTRGFHR